MLLKITTQNKNFSLIKTHKTLWEDITQKEVQGKAQSGVIEVIKNDKRITFSSNVKIHTWYNCCKHTNIFACRNISLLERMVVHGNFVYPDVFCRNRNDVQKSGVTEKTPQCQREANGAKSYYKT